MDGTSEQITEMDQVPEWQSGHYIQDEDPWGIVDNGMKFETSLQLDENLNSKYEKDETDGDGSAGDKSSYYLVDLHQQPGGSNTFNDYDRFNLHPTIQHTGRIVDANELQNAELCTGTYFNIYNKPVTVNSNKKRVLSFLANDREKEYQDIDDTKEVFVLDEESDRNVNDLNRHAESMGNRPVENSSTLSGRLPQYHQRKDLDQNGLLRRIRYSSPLTVIPEEMRAQQMEDDHAIFQDVILQEKVDTIANIDDEDMNIELPCSSVPGTQYKNKSKMQKSQYWNLDHQYHQLPESGYQHVNRNHPETVSFIEMTTGDYYSGNSAQRIKCSDVSPMITKNHRCKVSNRYMDRDQYEMVGCKTCTDKDLENEMYISHSCRPLHCSGRESHGQNRRCHQFSSQTSTGLNKFASGRRRICPIYSAQWSGSAGLPKVSPTCLPAIATETFEKSSPAFRYKNPVKSSVQRSSVNSLQIPIPPVPNIKRKTYKVKDPLSPDIVDCLTESSLSSKTSSHLHNSTSKHLFKVPSNTLDASNPRIDTQYPNHQTNTSVENEGTEQDSTGNKIDTEKIQQAEEDVIQHCGPLHFNCEEADHHCTNLGWNRVGSKMPVYGTNKEKNCDKNIELYNIRSSDCDGMVDRFLTSVQQDNVESLKSNMLEKSLVDEKGFIASCHVSPAQTLDGRMNSITYENADSGSVLHGLSEKNGMSEEEIISSNRKNLNRIVSKKTGKIVQMLCDENATEFTRIPDEPLPGASISPGVISVQHTKESLEPVGTCYMFTNRSSNMATDANPLRHSVQKSDKHFEPCPKTPEKVAMKKSGEEPVMRRSQRIAEKIMKESEVLEAAGNKQEDSQVKATSARNTLKRTDKGKVVRICSHTGLTQKQTIRGKVKCVVKNNSRIGQKYFGKGQVMASNTSSRLAKKGVVKVMPYDVSTEVSEIKNEHLISSEMLKSGSLQTKEDCSERVNRSIVPNSGTMTRNFSPMGHSVQKLVNGSLEYIVISNPKIKHKALKKGMQKRTVARRSPRLAEKKIKDRDVQEKTSSIENSDSEMAQEMSGHKKADCVVSKYPPKRINCEKRKGKVMSNTSPETLQTPDQDNISDTDTAVISMQKQEEKHQLLNTSIEVDEIGTRNVDIRESPSNKVTMKRQIKQVLQQESNSTRSYPVDKKTRESIVINSMETSPTRSEKDAIQKQGGITTDSSSPIWSETTVTGRYEESSTDCSSDATVKNKPKKKKITRKFFVRRSPRIAEKMMKDMQLDCNLVDDTGSRNPTVVMDNKAKTKLLSERNSPKQRQFTSCECSSTDYSPDIVAFTKQQDLVKDTQNWLYMGEEHVFENKAAGNSVEIKEDTRSQLGQSLSLTDIPEMEKDGSDKEDSRESANECSKEFGPNGSKELEMSHSLLGKVNQIQETKTYRDIQLDVSNKESVPEQGNSSLARNSLKHYEKQISSKESVIAFQTKKQKRTYWSNELTRLLGREAVSEELEDARADQLQNSRIWGLRTRKRRRGDASKNWTQVLRKRKQDPVDHPESVHSDSTELYSPDLSLPQSPPIATSPNPPDAMWENLGNMPATFESPLRTKTYIQKNKENGDVQNVAFKEGIVQKNSGNARRKQLMNRKDNGRDLQYKVKTRELDKTQEMETPGKEQVGNLGDLVWGKLGKSVYWPGIIITGDLVGKPQAGEGKAWIFWFGDHKISLLPHSKLKSFTENYSTCVSLSSKLSYRHAKLEAIKECQERAGLDMSTDDSFLLQWAQEGFMINGLSEPEVFRPHKGSEVPFTVSVKLEKLKNQFINLVTSDDTDNYDSDYSPLTKKFPGRDLLSFLHMPGDSCNFFQIHEDAYQVEQLNKIEQQLVKVPADIAVDLEPLSVSCSNSIVISSETELSGDVISNIERKRRKYWPKPLSGDVISNIERKKRKYRPKPPVKKRLNEGKMSVTHFVTIKSSDSENSAQVQRSFSTRKRNLQKRHNWLRLKMCKKINGSKKGNSRQNKHYNGSLKAQRNQKKWPDLQSVVELDSTDSLETEKRLYDLRPNRYRSFNRQPQLSKVNMEKLLRTVDFQPTVKLVNIKDYMKQGMESKNNEEGDNIQRQTVREKALGEVRERKENIEGVCLRCGSLQVNGPHPLFKGGLCINCKRTLQDRMFTYGEDNNNVYCAICACRGTLVLCDAEQCPRVFCTTCIQLLVGGKQEVLDQSPWFCYLCTAEGSFGLLERREDWRHQILSMYNPDGSLLSQVSITPIKSKAIRVLSLFDGIGTGRLVLSNLKIKVEVYYASEVEDASMLVTQVRHGEGVIQLGDVTSITRKKLEEISPIDLLIGGPPCNDLSIVNPARKGIEGGTGVLFFEYARILSELKVINKDRHIFWMMENVASMAASAKDIISRYLGCEPAVYDAMNFSPQRRKRLFWGNIPGLYCPEKFKKSDLQNVLMPTRQKKVDLVKCVTTNTNSLVQKQGIKPIRMGNTVDDIMWVPEIERLFGYPAHYTDVGNLSAQKRRSLLGRAWSVPVVEYLLKPLTQFFLLEDETQVVEGNDA